MRLVFLGTPEIAVPYLHALHDAGHEITLVVTRADKRRGRGGRVSPSPVKAAAAELGLPVSHDVDEVLTADAELGVVVAFGRIIRPDVLAALAMINVHFSLLPRWRGAAPVERAILAGDSVTGVCLMRVEEGLDTGGVYSCAKVGIDAGIVAAELRDRLVEAGIELLVGQLARPVEEWIDDRAPQLGEATYADKLSPAEFEIDWRDAPEQVDRLVRVGGAWTTFRGKRLKILRATLVDGPLVPTTVQPEGKAAMPFDAWRNGARPTADEIFGDL